MLGSRRAAVLARRVRRRDTSSCSSAKSSSWAQSWVVGPANWMPSAVNHPANQHSGAFRRCPRNGSTTRGRTPIRGRLSSPSSQAPAVFRRPRTGHLPLPLCGELDETSVLRSRAGPDCSDRSRPAGSRSRCRARKPPRRGMAIGHLWCLTDSRALSPRRGPHGPSRRAASPRRAGLGFGCCTCDSEDGANHPRDLGAGRRFRAASGGGQGADSP